MYGKVLAFAMLAAVAGLATGCPTVELGDNPPEPGICRPSPAYFENTVWPELIVSAAAPARSCVGEAACHRQSDGRSSMRLDFDPDQPDAVDFDGNYDVVTRFLNCGSPESSPFLTKPLKGIDSHGGGDFIDSPAENPNDPQYGVFITWFDQ